VGFAVISFIKVLQVLAVSCTAFDSVAVSGGRIMEYISLNKWSLFFWGGIWLCVVEQQNATF
jgi:hypothetical protein